MAESLQDIIDRYSKWKPGTGGYGPGGWTPGDTAASMMGHGDPHMYWHQMDPLDYGAGGGGGDLGGGGGHDVGIPGGGGGQYDYSGGSGGALGNPGGGGAWNVGSGAVNGGSGSGSGGYYNDNMPWGFSTDANGETITELGGTDWSSYLPSAQSMENFAGATLASSLGGPLAGMAAGQILRQLNPPPRSQSTSPSTPGSYSYGGLNGMDYQSDISSQGNSGSYDLNGSDLASDNGWGNSAGSGGSGGGGGGGSGSGGGSSGGSSGPVFVDLSGGMSLYRVPRAGKAHGGTVDSPPQQSDNDVVHDFLRHGLVQEPRLRQFGQELDGVMKQMSVAIRTRPDKGQITNYLQSEYMKPIAAAVREEKFPDALHLLTKLMEDAHAISQGDGK